MDKDTREKYLLIAKMNSYKRKLRRSIDTVKEAIDVCNNPVVSFSFGKDSLVCMDIARKIKPDILIVNIDRGEGGDLKEAVKLYDEFAGEYNLNYHRVKAPKSIIEIYKEFDNLNDYKHGTVKNNLLAGFKKARDKFNYDCEITGLRADESRERSYLRKYGTFHYSENEKIYKCKPVVYWSGAEIWAYIISNNLPYISYYDKEAKFMGYEEARYANWAGLVHKTYGRFLRLKVNYPDEFQLLAEVLPEIRQYV
jgi:phosphoadenosine phosphosulfate reductase